MCGICGFSGKPQTQVLKKMTEAIVHRGPDEAGSYNDPDMSLGARRLSIIDLKTGHQPIHNENEDIWIVFNGEIYNFKELRVDLEKKGHRFYTDHSDTEVLVHLYEEHGIDFTHMLNGMFAIAIWDKRRKELLLFRDRMGVKPLFYAVIGGNIIFASEIKSILRHPAYSKAINYEGIYHYLSFKNIPAPLTAFSGIFSLSPGERLVFSDHRAVTSRWWKVRFQENDACDEAYLKDRLLTLLDDATKIRMTSDVPFGAYLSGGVDSSAIVALMSRHLRQPVKTFSLGYEEDFKNKAADLYHARRVSDLFHTEHHEYIMSYKELLDDIDAVIAAFDQPFSGTISTFFLSKLIHKHVKVALSGDGADELFGSYLSHRIAAPMAQMRGLREKVSAGYPAEKGLTGLCEPGFFKRLFENSGGEDARWRYLLYLNTDKDKETLISEEVRNNFSGMHTSELIKRHFSTLTSRDPLNRILEYEWNTQFPDQVLAFVDFLSMAHSVEIRSPFIDHRLAEFAATIPGSFKIKEGNVKDILKKTVGDLIPDEITRRPKEGFVLPVYEWMQDKMKDYCCGVLSEKNVAKANLLNPNEVRAILASYYAGEKGLAGKVWNMAMLQVWWKQYFGDACGS